MWLSLTLPWAAASMASSLPLTAHHARGGGGGGVSSSRGVGTTATAWLIHDRDAPSLGLVGPRAQRQHGFSFLPGVVTPLSPLLWHGAGPDPSTTHHGMVVAEGARCLFDEAETLLPHWGGDDGVKTAPPPRSSAGQGEGRFSVRPSVSAVAPSLSLSPAGRGVGPPPGPPRPNIGCDEAGGGGGPPARGRPPRATPGPPHPPNHGREPQAPDPRSLPGWRLCGATHTPPRASWWAPRTPEPPRGRPPRGPGAPPSPPAPPHGRGDAGSGQGGLATPGCSLTAGPTGGGRRCACHPDDGGSGPPARRGAPRLCCGWCPRWTCPGLPPSFRGGAQWISDGRGRGGAVLAAWRMGHAPRCWSPGLSLFSPWRGVVWCGPPLPFPPTHTHHPRNNPLLQTAVSGHNGGHTRQAWCSGGSGIIMTRGFSPSVPSKPASTRQAAHDRATPVRSFGSISKPCILHTPWVGQRRRTLPPPTGGGGWGASLPLLGLSSSLRLRCPWVWVAPL